MCVFDMIVEQFRASNNIFLQNQFIKAEFNISFLKAACQEVCCSHTIASNIQLLTERKMKRKCLIDLNER